MRRRKPREESDQSATEDVGAEAQEISEEIGEDVGSENNFEDETTKEGCKSDEDVLLRDMLKAARRNLKRKRPSKTERKPRKVKAQK
ncbi:hypothetical protein Dimus_003149, partial [Dionaea muscipula]